MRLKLSNGIPFVDVGIVYEGRKLLVSGVLIDTGSASTIFAADVVRAVQIVPQVNDQLDTIFGIGGSEVVFSRKLDSMQVGEIVIDDFQIEVGGMDYGFQINGILGMDFLSDARAVIDLAEMELRFS